MSLKLRYIAPVAVLASIGFAATHASAALPVETGAWTRRTLGVTSRIRRSTNLGSAVHHNAPAGFGIEQSFRLGLRLFEFQFLGVFFALCCAAFRRRHDTRLGKRRHVDFRYSLADVGKPTCPSLRTGLAGRSRLFFKLVVAVVGRFFVADGIRFVFVDGLFFHFHRARRGETSNLRLRGGRHTAVGMLGEGHDVALFNNFFHGIRRIARPGNACAHRVSAVKLAVPVHGSRSGLDLFFVDGLRIVVLLMQWFGRGRGENRFVFREGRGDRRGRFRSRFGCSFFPPTLLRRRRWLRQATVLRNRFSGKHHRLVSGRRSKLRGAA